MGLPKKVREVVEKSEISPSLNFIETLSSINKKPVLKLYAYKHTKTRGIECKQVGRRFIDKDQVTGSIYYHRMAGYQVVFKGVKQIGYFKIEADDHFYDLNRSDMYYPPAWNFEKLYTAEELEAAFKGTTEKLKYLVVPSLEDIADVMDYLRTYQEQPKLELLAKAGLEYLWAEKQMYKLGNEKSKVLMRYIKDNLEYIKLNRPTYRWMMDSIKAGLNAEQFNFYTDVQYLTVYSREHHLKLKPEIIKEACKFVKKQQAEMQIYCDYLDACRKLGIKLKDRGVLFPRNINESHDNVTAKLDEKLNRSTNEGLREACKILKQFIGDTGEFHLVLPKSQAMLIEWGNKLHNCVGKLGYGTQMSKGQTIIIGIFKDLEIVECCEIGRQFKKDDLEIIQCRGDNNMDSPYHKTALTLVNNFITAYKPQNLMGNVI